MTDTQRYGSLREQGRRDAGSGGGPALAEVATHKDVPFDDAASLTLRLTEASISPELEQASTAVDHDPLGDLSFIGSNSLSSSFEVEPIEPPQGWRAPSASLETRNSDTRQQEMLDARAQSIPLPDLEPPEPALLPPQDLAVAASAREPAKPHPLDSSGASVGGAGLVDFDGAPPSELAPLPAELEPGRGRQRQPRSEAGGHSPAPAALGADPDAVEPRRPFSSSLMTSDDFDDD